MPLEGSPLLSISAHADRDATATAGPPKATSIFLM